MIFFLSIFSWKKELQLYEFYSGNLIKLKTKAINDEKVPEHIRQKLYDKRLEDQVLSGFNSLDQIAKISNSEENVSDIIIRWLALYNTTALMSAGDQIYTKVFSAINLAAHAFNPKHKDNDLSNTQKSTMRFYVLRLLRDPDEFSKFDEYLDGTGEFGQEELLEMDSKAYWKLMKGYCNKLSKLALILTSLPAKTSQAKRPTFPFLSKNLDPITAKKINFIKSSFE